jgi:hypothetical protein
MFEAHDYYVYPIIFLIPLSIGMMCCKLKAILTDYSSIQRFSVVSVGLILLFIQNAVPNFDKRRWDTTYNHQDFYANYKGADEILLRAGVSKESKIISLSDITPNYSLVLLDRKGWSAYQAFYMKWTISQFIAKGAEYLVLNDRLESWEAIAHAKGYLDYPLASENDLNIYDLRPYVTN